MNLIKTHFCKLLCSHAAFDALFALLVLIPSPVVSTSHLL